jgi:hypothetical protein
MDSTRFYAKIHAKIQILQLFGFSGQPHSVGSALPMLIKSIQGRVELDSHDPQF